MEQTNRQKKIGGVIQKDLVDILQGEVRKNGITNLIFVINFYCKISPLVILNIIFYIPKILF